MGHDAPVDGPDLLIEGGQLLLVLVLLLHLGAEGQTMLTQEQITQLSPMMQQYLEIKNQHKDQILFFRVGWDMMRP